MNCRYLLLISSLFLIALPISHAYSFVTANKICSAIGSGTACTLGTLPSTYNSFFFAGGTTGWGGAAGIVPSCSYSTFSVGYETHNTRSIRINPNTYISINETESGNSVSNSLSLTCTQAGGTGTEQLVGLASSEPYSVIEFTVTGILAESVTLTQ